MTQRPCRCLQRSRLHLAAILSALTLVLLTLFSTGALAADPIRSASELDYPPFSIVTKDGQADGFGVEMLRESLSAMGYGVVFSVAPWHKIKQDLAEGRIQVLPLVARTAERQADFDFTAPYLTVHGTIVVRRGDSRIRRAEDLRDKTIVVMKGDSSEEYVQRVHLSDKVVSTETLEEALKQLAAGQHDAMVLQTLAAENLIRTLRLSNLETVGPPLPNYHDFCFAVRKGDKELLAILNEGLSLVVSDGTRERLREKWITPTPDERIEKFLLLFATAMGALLLAASVGYLWQRTLRAQVRSRTAALAVANMSQLDEIQRRQQSEAELRESKENLAITLRSIGDAVIATDVHGRVTGMNPVAERLTGWTEVDALGHPLPDVFHIVNTQNRSVMPDPVQQVLARGQVTMLADHTVLLARSGEEYQVSDSAAPIRNAAGQIVGVVLVFSDVTERYRIEQELRESEVQYRTLANSGQALIWTAGTDKLCNYFTRMFHKPAA